MLGRGARCLKRDAFAIVCAKPDLPVALPAMVAALGRTRCEGRLANSIGIDWKGTQPPLKTDRADTLIFNLRAYLGGAVAI